MNKLEEITAGEVIVDGHNLTDKPIDINKVRENVGMVFQHFNLFPHMNVTQNLMLAPVELKKATKDEARQSAIHMLEKVGMADKADTYPAQLSGGQKQRLCIARALLKKPKILILDDSTSAVDTKTDALIRKAFREEIPNTTKIIIAQRVSSIEDADQIIVLDGGQIMGIGTSEELLKTNEIYREVYESQVKGGGDHE